MLLRSCFQHQNLKKNRIINIFIIVHFTLINTSITVIRFKTEQRNIRINVYRVKALIKFLKQKKGITLQSMNMLEKKNNMRFLQCVLDLPDCSLSRRCLLIMYIFTATKQMERKTPIPVPMAAYFTSEAQAERDEVSLEKIEEVIKRVVIIHGVTCCMRIMTEMLLLCIRGMRFSEGTWFLCRRRVIPSHTYEECV